MPIYNRSCKLAIWGTGKLGRKIYYRYRSRYEIICFIDSYGKLTELYGLPVIKPDQIAASEYKVIIASVYFDEIAKQCNDLGLSYYENFISIKAFESKRIYPLEILKYAREEIWDDAFSVPWGGKKKVIILGNCQTQRIGQLLECSKEFVNNYVLMEIPAVNVFPEAERELFFQYGKNICDVLITQRVKETNRFDYRFSTDRISQYLSPKKLIIIPVLFFDVYFPQGARQKSDVLKDVIDVGIYPYGDRVLDELALKYNMQEIVQIVSMDNFFGEDFLKRYYRMWESDFKEREKDCDVSILDFIIDNYKKMPLFFTRNHPARLLMAELARRILQQMGIDSDLERTDQVAEMDFTQEFIYPSVYKGLGLEFRKTDYLDCESKEPHTFEEEVRKYLSYIHDLKE